MITLNSTSLKALLNPGVVNAGDLLESINFMISYQKLCQDLMREQQIKNVAIVTTIDTELNLKVVADFLNNSNLIVHDERAIVTQLITAISNFHDEYTSVVDEKISGTGVVSVSDGFKRIFNSYNKLGDISVLNIAGENVPTEKIDKTLLRTERSVHEAPLEGLGVAEIFDYNDMSISITPDALDGKKFQKIKVLCNLELSVEMMKLRYSDRFLHGYYCVEIINEKYVLKSFEIKQISLDFD